MCAAISDHLTMPFWMHRTMVSSSSFSHDPFTRPGRSTFCQRCKHCTSERWLCRNSTEIRFHWRAPTTETPCRRAASSSLLHLPVFHSPLPVARGRGRERRLVLVGRGDVVLATVNGVPAMEAVGDGLPALAGVVAAAPDAGINAVVVRMGTMLVVGIGAGVEAGCIRPRPCAAGRPGVAGLKQRCLAPSRDAAGRLGVAPVVGALASTTVGAVVLTNGSASAAAMAVALRDTVGISVHGCSRMCVSACQTNTKQRETRHSDAQPSKHVVRSLVGDTGAGGEGVGVHGTLCSNGANVRTSCCATLRAAHGGANPAPCSGGAALTSKRVERATLVATQSGKNRKWGRVRDNRGETQPVVY